MTNFRTNSASGSKAETEARFGSLSPAAQQFVSRHLPEPETAQAKAKRLRGEAESEALTGMRLEADARAYEAAGKPNFVRNLRQRAEQAAMRAARLAAEATKAEAAIPKPKATETSVSRGVDLRGPMAEAYDRFQAAQRSAQVRGSEGASENPGAVWDKIRGR